MAIKEKKKGSAKGRRAALKGFASRAKGMFQSPVHSNGYKQDMLIDVYGGDVGFKSSDIHVNTAAGQAHAAGKTYFYHDGELKKAVASGRGSISGVSTDSSDVAGKTRPLTK
tara:strand:+ start:6377 stop:6712 length:336 start_codon:yes stop_codon:yes gene_type:complete